MAISHSVIPKYLSNFSLKGRVIVNLNAYISCSIYVNYADNYFNNKTTVVCVQLSVYSFVGKTFTLRTETPYIVH